jgi:hypothetical protein
MFSSLVHLIWSLSISYSYLIKFHDFADNNQEGMKHQTRSATQASPTGHDFIYNSNVVALSGLLVWECPGSKDDLQNIIRPVGNFF